MPIAFLVIPADEIINYGMKEQFKDTRPIPISATVMAAGVYYLNIFLLSISDILIIITHLVAGTIIYLWARAVLDRYVLREVKRVTKNFITQD